MDASIKAQITFQDIVLSAARDGMSITEQEAKDWLERNRGEIEASMIRMARAKIDELMKDDPPDTAFHQMLGQLDKAFQKAVDQFAKKNRSSAMEWVNSEDDFREIARDFSSSKRTEATSVIGIKLEKDHTDRNYRCHITLHNGKITMELEPQQSSKNTN